MSVPLSPAVMAFLGTLAVSLLSLIGILLFLISERHIRRSLLWLVGLSTGALFGDVFLHIFPELAEDAPSFPRAMIYVLVGIVFSFVVEKVIHWRHCHMLPGHHCTDHDHDHHHSVGVMALLGETVHNFVDGIVIAAAFLINPAIGVSTTFAIVFHEVPHEIGNFAVLLHSGFTRRRALFFNGLSALSGIAGTIAVLAVSGFEGAVVFLLPFAAGNLLYIAGSDLIPELHRSTKASQGVMQLLSMLVGIAIMAAMLALE